MSIGEFFSVKWRICRDQAEAVRLYYKSPRFALLDLSFCLLSLISNPYRVCRKFLQKRGESDVYAYGETPYSTLEKIARHCEARPSDRWLELGSGRGKGCFWIAHFIGCETIGVEWIPSFIRTAHFLKNCFGTKNLSFQNQNIEEADFSKATIIYLYGTSFSNEMISRLVQKMEALPKGARVVSVSYPLECGHLENAGSFQVLFPWGGTEAFLHRKI